MYPVGRTHAQAVHGGGTAGKVPLWVAARRLDLRYQLIVIGTFAQAIVGEKVKDNRFTIRTSAPHVEVSWQVTGVRSDAAMARHPFRAEEDKPRDERGTYLDPEAFARPGERGVGWVRHAEMMERLARPGIDASPTEPGPTKRVARQK